MGHHRQVLDRTLRAHPKVQRLHHPHLDSLPLPYPRHLQAQHWCARPGRDRRRHFAFAARRVLARGASRSSGQDKGGLSCRAAFTEPHRRRRGAPVPLACPAETYPDETSSATTRSKSTSSPTPPTSPVSTSTASITTRQPSRPSPPPRSPRSLKPGASSRPPSPSSPPSPPSRPTAPT